ncbi:MAG TPA: DnaJ domain-containing protein [Longimicrobiales bacterium]|nr:DnaJ domain-containing protein [Longimicrobiales bacterium]
MVGKPWVDHYEALQLSPSADPETVERVYRLLAKRYHPDNKVSGDAERFKEIREAHDVLSDPDNRASYDASYETERKQQWQIFDQANASGDRDDDQRLFQGILSLLYIARRRDPERAGMAPAHLERLLGVPSEHLTFPLWYLKKRNYVEILENGLMAISVDGIDKLGNGKLTLPVNRLIAAESVSRPDPEEAEPQERLAAVGA